MNRNSHKYGFSLCYTGCPKKVGFTFTANLEAINGLKSKSGRKQTPPSILPTEWCFIVSLLIVGF